MHILFITPYVPSRIRVRSYGLLAELCKEHEVTILALCRTQRELDDTEALRNRGYDIVTVMEPTWHAVLRSGLALASSQPLQVAFARSARLSQAAQYLCTERHFDVVHIEHLRGIAATYPLVNTHPVVWDAVDCLSLLQKHTIVSGPNLPVRATAAVEYRRTQHYESRLLKQLQYVTVSSERDRQALIDVQTSAVEDKGTTKIQQEATIITLPNGVDLDYFRRETQKRRRFNLVFSGKMNYHPNIATVLYLYKRVMPLIWQRLPEATLTIAGGYPTEAIRRLGDDPRVEVTGYVDDMRPYISRAEVMLCPMVYSTGIQNKILEAMALGTPVVLSPHPLQALQAVAGQDLLVANSPQGFADTVLRLFDDTELWEALSWAGRLYVERHHGWQSVKNKLVDIYHSAIREHIGGAQAQAAQLEESLAL